MNRRNFFKNLTATVVGVIMAPAVVAKIARTETPGFDAKKLDDRIKDIRENYVCIDVDGSDKYEANAVLKMWKERGVVLFKPLGQENYKIYVDSRRIKEWKSYKR